MKRLLWLGLVIPLFASPLWAQGKSVEELFHEASSAELQYAPLRKPAEEELVRRGEEAIPYLVGKLGTRDARERHALERVLRRIKGPAVKPLIEALRTNDLYALRLGVRILGLIGDERALSPLVKLSSHPDWKVRSVVAFALGRIGKKRATSVLISALRDSVDLVRKSAAVGLGELNDERAISSLLRSLSDPFYAVRNAAAQDLAKLGGSVLDSLLTILQEPPGEGRYFVIQVLGEIGNKRALKPLVSLLQARDWATRAFAAQAIGGIGGEGARRALGSAKKGERHPYVLLQIRKGLSRLEKGETK